MIFDVSSMTKQQQLTLWGEDSPNVSTAHFVMRMSIVSCEVTLSTTVVMGDSVRSILFYALQLATNAAHSKTKVPG